MPYRLRVAFDPQQFLTLQAVSGTFAVSGKAATFEYVPISVSADVWTRLDTGGYVYGNTRAGPDINQGWTQSAIDTSRGFPFAFQGYAQDTNRGNFFFNTSLGYWERTNTIQNDWHRNTGAISENYDICYDADRNVFWRSTGGPFGGNALVGAGTNEAGPWLGDGKYDVTADEWSTPWPESDSTWVALPGDTGYFGTPGATLTGSDACHEYYNDHVYAFGGWSIASTQYTHKRNLTTGAISSVVAYANCPPWTLEPARLTNHRSGLIRSSKTLYTLANGGALWTYSLLDGGTAWTQITTTGDAPDIPTPPSHPTYAYGDYGLIASVDEAANCLVAWCGYGALVGETMDSIRKTWILDLATRVWRAGPSFAGGDTVPPAAVAVSETMLYDPVLRRTLMTVGVSGGHYTQVWALQVAPVGGIITSWPLPARSGSTYGTNYYGFPFTSNGSSKHVNMAYCPANGRLYATGGDSIHSATDGIWSMSLEDGSWRLDVGQPVYGTTVAPHAYQDGCLFQWMPSRNKFIFGFGPMYGYEADGSAIYNYSSGYWMFDPIAGTWEQVAAFFTNPTLSHSVSGTGNLYGGVYDEDTDTVYVLGEGITVGLGCKRYNIGTGVQDSTISFTVPSSGVSGYIQPVFGRGRQCQIGRYIYAIGYYSDGVGYIPALWRYGIDDHTFIKLAQPPAFTESVQDEELVLVSSGGKLLHPRRNGPEGNMTEGMHIYNPANDSWSTDTKTPAYGAYIANSVCSLLDGRVAMSGGAFGSQQTHMWFYEAT